MEVDVQDSGDEVMKVTLKDANPAVANSLRRAMSSLVPTLAVKHIDVTRNESALFDELLASRIGQIPFNIPDDVDSEDTIHVAANVDGPGEFVSSDIQTDRGVEPQSSDILLADLKDGQGIEFEGEAVLGRGREHAKHQGGTVGYEKTGEGEFLFRIESTSGYSNEELFEAALSELQSRLEDFQEQVEEL